MFARQSKQESWTCRMENILLGLMAGTVLCILVVSQELYNRNFVKFNMAPRLNKQPQARLHFSVPSNPKTVVTMKTKCPDVLRFMSVGRWVKKKSYEKEIGNVEKPLEHSRKQLYIIGNLSRADGRCGNVTLSKKYTRALCNPKGDKPCCYENICKAISIEKCQCKNCYDMRQRIHAEYATWTPADQRCKMRNFTASEACSLLSGSHLYLIGDSYMRHLYIGFMMLLKNDWRFAALKPSISEEWRLRCEGTYSFASKECRRHLNFKPSLFCNGTLNVTYILHKKKVDAPEFLQLVKQTINKAKVIIMPGIGVHDRCNATNTKQYIGPVAKLLKSKRVKWPKLIWASVHAPGLMKSPVHSRQSFQRIAAFNKEMKKYLDQFKIPIFDTFNLTSQAVSFDGGHFGLGANIAKAQFFLNYLQELRYKGQW